MIASLELRNWRSHAHTKLQFGKGTNLIVGPMGSGKSTALDGICYALYGTFPALRRKSIGMEDVLRHGEKEAQVVLEFVHNGKTYRVVRGLKVARGVEAAAKIYEDGKLLEAGQSRVSEFIAEMLGVGFDLFNRAVYSEQNNIGYFLELEAGRRKREMDGLMGLDRFEEARANAVRVINRVEGERKVLMQKYDEARHAELERSLNEKKKLLREEEENAKEAERELVKRKKEAESAERELEEMRKNKERKEKIIEEIRKGRARAEALEADLEGREISEGKLAEKRAELGEAERDLEKVGEEISGLEKESAALSRNIGVLESRLKSLEMAEEERKKAQEALRRLLGGKSAEEFVEKEKGLELEMVELGSLEKSLLKEAEEIEKYLPGLEGRNECPVCGAELGRERAEHIEKERRAVAKRKREEAGEAGRKRAKLEKELLETKRILREAARAEGKLKIEVEDRKKVEGELAEVRKKAEKNAEAMERLREKRKTLEKKAKETLLALREMEGLLEKRKALGKTMERLRALEGEEKEVKFSTEEYEKLYAGARGLLMECERAEGRVREARRGVASLKEMVGVLEKEAGLLDAMKEEICRRERMAEQLVLMKNAISETQAELRSELVEAINSAMNEIWPILYPYGDYRQLRIAASEEDYVFEVYDGEWRRLEKVASGGEKACLSLTLRIALATVLAPEAGWLILDEPTHNLDRESVQALAEALESKVPQLVEQAFVITHEETLMNSEFARSYKFSREKEAGGATVVEEL